MSTEKGRYGLEQMPCRYLHEQRCSVYDVRPDDCRSFPHLQKREFRSRLIGVVENCSICPIVYNVFERLKLELWGRRRNVGDKWTFASGTTLIKAETPLR